MAAAARRVFIFAPYSSIHFPSRARMSQYVSSLEGKIHSSCACAWKKIEVNSSMVAYMPGCSTSLFIFQNMLHTTEMERRLYLRTFTLLWAATQLTSFFAREVAFFPRDESKAKNLRYSFFSSSSFLAFGAQALEGTRTERKSALFLIRAQEK